MKSFICVFLVVLAMPLCAQSSTNPARGSQAFMSSCEKAAQEAFNRGSHHIVFTMEGLTGELAELFPIGHTRNGLARKIKEVHDADFDIRGYSHALGPERIARCAQSWSDIHGRRLRITIMGHSLGGGQSMIDAANNLAALNIEVDTIVSLDGRTGPETKCGDEEEPYQQPDNVGRVYNFRRCGLGFDGREWDGPNVQNFLIDSGHSRMPYHPRVHQVLGPVLTGPPFRRNLTQQIDEQGAVEELIPIRLLEQ